MTDMLVKLYELPALEPHLERARAAGVDIRRALPPEKHHILAWIRERFGEAWVSEADVSCNAKPPTCFVAVRDGALLGFSCYDATGLGMFGPIGVDGRREEPASARRCWSHACTRWLPALFYAVIGGVGPAEVLRKNRRRGRNPGLHLARIEACCGTLTLSQASGALLKFQERDVCGRKGRRLL